MADLVTIATTAALTQFVGPAAKHLGEQALARAKQVASRAADLLKTAGREPQPVAPKLLLPLVQGAGLETDPQLAELWAALLANAADPAQRVAVQPGFADVLRQLTPTDAHVLLAMSDSKQKQQHDAGTLSYLLAQVQTASTNTSEQAIEVSVGNIMRLGLARGFNSQMLQAGNTLHVFWATSEPKVERVYLMPFGWAFLQAVTPPTP